MDENKEYCHIFFQYIFDEYHTLRDLRNGKLLCQLLLQIAPNVIPPVSSVNSPNTSYIYHLQQYADGCQKLQLDDAMFNLSNLYNEIHMDKVFEAIVFLIKHALKNGWVPKPRINLSQQQLIPPPGMEQSEMPLPGTPHKPMTLDFVVQLQVGKPPPGLPPALRNTSSDQSRVLTPIFRSKSRTTHSSICMQSLKAQLEGLTQTEESSYNDAEETISKRSSLLRSYENDSELYRFPETSDSVPFLPNNTNGAPPKPFPPQLSSLNRNNKMAQTAIVHAGTMTESLNSTLYRTIGVESLDDSAQSVVIEKGVQKQKTNNERFFRKVIKSHPNHKLLKSFLDIYDKKYDLIFQRQPDEVSFLNNHDNTFNIINSSPNFLIFFQFEQFILESIDVISKINDEVVKQNEVLDDEQNLLMGTLYFEFISDILNAFTKKVFNDLDVVERTKFFKEVFRFVELLTNFKKTLDKFIHRFSSPEEYFGQNSSLEVEKISKYHRNIKKDIKDLAGETTTIVEQRFESNDVITSQRGGQSAIVWVTHAKLVDLICRSGKKKHCRVLFSTLSFHSSAEIVFDLFVNAYNRFSVLADAENSEFPTYQFNCAQALILWIEEFPEEFRKNHALKRKISDFANKSAQNDFSFEYLINLLESVNATVDNLSNSFPIINSNINISNLLKEDKGAHLRIAQSLLRIDSMLIENLSTSDLINYVMKDEKSEVLDALLKRNERMKNWVKTSIVSAKTMARSVNMILNFIQIVNVLFDLCDFYSYFSILEGMYSIPEKDLQEYFNMITQTFSSTVFKTFNKNKSIFEFSAKKKNISFDSIDSSHILSVLVSMKRRNAKTVPFIVPLLNSLKLRFASNKFLHPQHQKFFQFQLCSDLLVAVNKLMLVENVENQRASWDQADVLLCNALLNQI